MTTGYSMDTSEYFDRWSFAPEAMQARTGRTKYGIFALALHECTDCGCLTIEYLEAWRIRVLFPRGLSLDRQIRRAGWRYKAKDSTLCVPCFERRRGILCAFCGMRRQIDAIAESIGDPGYQDHVCQSCRDTMPTLLWEIKLNELRARHAEQDTTDEDPEEPEPDME